MSLLDKVSLLVTPNAVKASKLYAIIPSNGTGDLTVTRSTTATRVNSLGLIESVAANVPRLNYNSVGGAPSILGEPQRTNLLLNSETLSTQSITTTAVAHTLSFRGNGTVTLSGSFSGSLVGTGANNRVTLTFTPTAATLTVTIIGSCANGQIEVGAFATSYIFTEVSAVTRNSDVISKTGMSDLIGQTEGVLFVEWSLLNFGGQEIAVNDDFVNYISFGFLTISGNFLIRVVISGSSSITILSSAPISNLGDYKILLKYKSGENKLFINGVLIATSTNSITFSNSLNSLFLHKATGKYYGNGSKGLKNIQLYKTALTDAECVSLTNL